LGQIVVSGIFDLTQGRFRRAVTSEEVVGPEQLNPTDLVNEVTDCPLWTGRHCELLVGQRALKGNVLAEAFDEFK
jgi:hypothetical protein